MQLSVGAVHAAGKHAQPFTGMPTHARDAQVNELKRLLLALGIAQSEARKVQEQLDECRKHAAFLDAITPPEWFAACSAQHAADWQAWHAAQPV